MYHQHGYMVLYSTVQISGNITTIWENERVSDTRQLVRMAAVSVNNTRCEVKVDEKIFQAFEVNT